jgi:transglutaminase-like putative cysteine protease/lipoprotein NlpI
MRGKFWPALLLALTVGAAQAQTPPSPRPAKPASKATLAAHPAVPAGAGYRFGPAPAWVKSLPAAESRPAAAVGAKARREPLVDVQVQLASRSSTATYVHLQHEALDTSTLRDVSEPQIHFNPAFQQVVIHQLAVLRNGQRLDRLKDARIELMRREQQLEHQLIDGVRTALVVLNDVRVGDVVDLAYTLEGENPIFEGRYSALLQLASDAPVERLHLRIEAPPERRLAVKALASDVVPERFEEGGRQVIRVLRERVPAVQDEASTPPWFKVYPALQVSEYGSWAEVDQWAQRLFAIEPASPSVAAKAAELTAQGATPEQQVAAALAFVQDEVRYFSASLGESSHRPKPAARTLAERLGDCKDKTLLLNSLLAAMGFDARPALVSMVRNRGIANYLPSHDQFDHVISRVQLGEAVYFLDPTMNGQGRSLEKRGYFRYGAALVVGQGEAGPQPVVPPSFAQDSLSFRQDWDFSQLARPAQLTTSFKAVGLAAERWRAHLATAGLERLAESIGGAYVRLLPGLVSVGQPEVTDDLDSNEWVLKLHFEHPSIGRYQRGWLDLEFPAAELADALPVPPEARRRMPFQLEGTRAAELRVSVTGARPFTAQPPAPQQLADKHFAFASRVEVSGATVQFISRVDRRSDEVLPADLDGYRERVGRARQMLGGQRLRLNLVDRKALETPFAEVAERMARFRNGARPDALWELMLGNEINRLVDAQLLAQVAPGSRLAVWAHIERAQSHNQLGDFALALADAEAALAIRAEGDEGGAALEAKGVALIGLGRPTEALAAFNEQARQAGTGGSWLGTAHYMLGDYAQAEATLRDSAANASGEARQFTLLWLYLAAERQGGRGREAIADELAAADAGKWSGALLSYLGGGLDRESLLKLAREKPETERLRLAEAYFFIGQQLAAQGRRGEALPWFERTLTTQAVPYREFTLAKWELKRGAN